MIDKNEALFVVRLPAGQKTIPYKRVPELIALAQARAKSPDYDPYNVSGDEEVIFPLNVWLEQDALKAAARSGEVEVLDNSFHRLSAGRLENGLLTVRALRGYLESMHGFLEVEDAPEPHAKTPSTAPKVAVGDGTDQTPDPERRLARLRALGGTAKYARGEWKFTGMVALVESEKAEKRKRTDEKTIRADLKEAAQTERDDKSAGFGAGLGQR